MWCDYCRVSILQDIQAKHSHLGRHISLEDLGLSWDLNSSQDKSLWNIKLQKNCETYFFARSLKRWQHWIPFIDHLWYGNVWRFLCFSSLSKVMTTWGHGHLLLYYHRTICPTVLHLQCSLYNIHINNMWVLWVSVQLSDHDPVLAALSRTPTKLFNYPGENQLLHSGILVFISH